MGDTLNITITANENLSSAEITILNSTYTMNITGQIANASVIVNASHADGQVKFNITTFDLAGNNLTVTQANLNSQNLQYLIALKSDYYSSDPNSLATIV